MDIVTIFLLALALAIDAFAVAVAAGSVLGRAHRRQVFRLSFHFGLFQFLMPLLGWLAGREVVNVIAAYDHWVAFGLLGFIGGRMMFTSISGETQRFNGDMTRGWMLVGLSLATSMDALAVGFSLALAHTDIIAPALVIGVVACGMTVIGMRLGRQFSQILGRKMEFIGGLILIFIGIRVVLEHMGVWS